MEPALSGRQAILPVLLSIFAGLALLVALVGVYSVITNLVAARTREIAIRLAIGASPGGIGRMVAWQSLRPLAAGLVVGLAGTLVVTRVLQSMLHQVGARDLVTLFWIRAYNVQRRLPAGYRCSWAPIQIVESS